MYHRYWYYSRQGVPSVGFPLPIVGTSLEWKKYIVQKDEFQLPQIQQYLKDKFGENQPKIVMDFRYNPMLLYANDPECLDDLYIAKNKFFDKHDRSKNLLYELFGESLLFDQTNERWATKRKHLSVAFYKDKMQKLLNIIISITNQRVQDWKEKYVHCNEDKEMSLTQEISTLIMDCIQACVFGKKNRTKMVEFEVDGKKVEMLPGLLLRDIFYNLQQRNYKPYRMLFEIFDRKFIGKDEKHTLYKCRVLRNYIKDLIEERRQELKQNIDSDKGDFLTILLNDDYFSGSVEEMVDECVTFMFASNSTSSLLIQNALYRLSMHDDVRQKVIKEIERNIHSEDTTITLSDISSKQWQKILTYDSLGEKWNYTFQVIQETLRIDASARNSQIQTVTETTEIAGVSILKGDMIMINIHQIHYNPREWREPYEFRPERFDPSSEWYLTPQGKKRHPQSLSPFLGGKRICIGKTFAENIAKCIIPIILGQLQFEITNEIYKIRKPTNTIVMKTPPYLVKVHLAK